MILKTQYRQWATIWKEISFKGERTISYSFSVLRQLSHPFYVIHMWCVYNIKMRKKNLIKIYGNNPVTKYAFCKVLYKWCLLIFLQYTTTRQQFVSILLRLYRTINGNDTTCKTMWIVSNHKTNKNSNYENATWVITLICVFVMLQIKKKYKYANILFMKERKIMYTVE
jgi:hypothetical protein